MCFKKLTRHFFYIPRIKRKLMHVGKNFYVGKNFTCELYKNVSIGDNVYIGDNMLILSTIAKVFIGDDTMFAPNVTIVTGDHKIYNTTVSLNKVLEKDKISENDADVIFEGNNWIGVGAIILKGVIVKRGAVIGAGAVVTKNVPENAVVAGNPAHQINTRL